MVPSRGDYILLCSPERHSLTFELCKEDRDGTGGPRSELSRHRRHEGDDRTFHR
jgi:hypothetical protein